MACCGRNNGACVCAQEATCSCGKQPALQCSTSLQLLGPPHTLTRDTACAKAAAENKLPTSTCACGKRAEGKSTSFATATVPCLTTSYRCMHLQPQREHQFLVSRDRLHDQEINPRNDLCLRLDCISEWRALAVFWRS